MLYRLTWSITRCRFYAVGDSVIHRQRFLFCSRRFPFPESGEGIPASALIRVSTAACRFRIFDAPNHSSDRHVAPRTIAEEVDILLSPACRPHDTLHPPSLGRHGRSYKRWTSPIAWSAQGERRFNCYPDLSNDLCVGKSLRVSSGPRTCRWQSLF